uniref:F-box domain-containing protein n=2 Tax=Mycena chlorophos TaxID=658473 RepID=A0ABQ0LMS9_MYCCL|nr:predicted protein [Mycena chlorophos]
MASPPAASHQSSSLHWRSDPPAHLFATNDAPNAADARVVRKILALQQTHLDSLNLGIAQLHVILRKLETERAELGKRMAVNAGLLSPLRSLPVEVLEEIFIRAVPEPGERKERLFVKQSPWSIARVCRRWRAVAYGYPKLWSTISIDLEDSAPTAPLLLRQLKLSTTYPLRIHFWSAVSFDAGLDLLQILALHAERWELADIRITSAVQARMLDKLGKRLSRLRYLRLEWRLPSTQHQTELVGVFGKTPALRYVTLSDTGSGTRTLGIQWPRLTSLDLTASALNMVAILRLCTALVECRLRPLGYDNNLGALVRLPHLRKLYSTDTQIFQHLFLPALTDLYLPHDCTQLVTALIQRSGCTLRSLYTFEGCTPRAVLRILSECPSLARLGMQFSSSWGLSDLLHYLTPAGALDKSIRARTLVPQLAALAIGITGPPQPHNDEQLLEDLFEVAAARSGSSSLRTFGLFLPQAVWSELPEVEHLSERLELLRRHLYSHVAFTDDGIGGWGGCCVPRVLDAEGWMDPMVYFTK